MASKHPPAADWMGEEDDACTKLTPFEFCFPGSHDSGAFHTPSGQAVRGQKGILNKIIKLNFVKKIVSPWTVTHPGQTVKDQLENGVRFLDLRVAVLEQDSETDGQPVHVLSHTFAISSLKEVAKDVVDFLSAHPKEIIIIDANPIMAIDHEELRRTMIGHLGPHRVCPGSKLQPLAFGEGSPVKVPTVREITDAGYGVILIVNMWREEEVDGVQDDRMLYADTLVSGYRSIIDVTEKKRFNKKMLVDYMAEKEPEDQDRVFFQLPHTVTPDAKSIAKDVFSGKNLMTHADQMNATLDAFVFAELRAEQRDAINIISVDNVVFSNVVDVARRIVQDKVKRVRRHNDVMQE